MNAYWRSKANRLMRVDHVVRRLRDALLAAALVWCVLALIYAFTANTALGFFVTVGAYAGLGAAAVFAGLSLIITVIEFAVVRELVAGNREQAVGLLLNALDLEDDRSRRIAARALTRLLPRVHSLSNADLSEIHRAIMTGDPRREPALIVALLKVIGRLGGPASLEVAESAAKAPAESAQEKKVSRTAGQSAAALRKRLASTSSVSHHATLTHK